MASIVRRGLGQILYIAGKLTAYDAHRHYIKLFGPTTRRNVYYQLQKGVDLGLFKIVEVVEEDGDYSWGVKARKVYYSIKNKDGIIPTQKIIKYFQVKR